MNKYDFDTNTKELYISGKKIDLSNSGFKLDCEIGSGRNGIVLKGLDILLDRTVAIKFWLPYKDGDKKPDINKFRNEIQKLALLDSEKSVKIYHAGIIENDYFYAVYEFVQGEPLKEWLKREQNFNSRCFVLEQIYEEMRKVHKMGIYHGDLHTGNVLIKSDLNIKIIDFGTSYFSKTKVDSYRRETSLLLNTGLSILKHEDKKYNLLEKDILKASLPECIPCSMLMLKEAYQKFNRLENSIVDELDDYDKGSMIGSLAYSVCNSPFFNLDSIIRFLQNSILDSEYIDSFVASTNYIGLASIIEVDKFTIFPMKANKENINQLKLCYGLLRLKHLETFKKINTVDN